MVKKVCLKGHQEESLFKIVPHILLTQTKKMRIRGYFILSRRLVFLVVLIGCLTIFIDTSLIQLSIRTGTVLSQPQELVTLSIIIIVPPPSQFLIIKFVGSGLKANSKLGYSNVISNMVVLIQSTLMFLIVVILMEVMLSSVYQTILLKAILVLSYFHC